MTGVKILVVEDESITARDIRETLKSRGYDVPAVALSGEEAIQKAEEIQPDLVLMDIMLKGDVDGIEAAEQIRRRFDIPVVYLTAYANNETVKRAKITEPFGYIIKPFEERELYTNIEMALYKHKMERALRESRDYLENLTNSMWDAVFCVKMPERVIEWVNDSFRLTGYEPADCIGKTTEFLYLDKEEFLAFGRKLKKVIAEGNDVLHAEHLLKRKNGEVFPAEITTTIFREKGEIRRVTSIVGDITERKQAEAEMRIKDIAIASSINGIAIADLEGKLTYVNDSFVEMWGYDSEKEVLGRDAVEFWRIDGKTKIALESLHEENGHVSELLVQRKDGSLFGVQVSASVVLDKDREPVCIMNSFVDISGRIQAEKKLMESEHEKALILGTLSEIVVYQDTELRTIWANRTAAESVGQTVDNLVGRHCYEVWHQRSEVCVGCPVKRAIETGRAQEAEMSTPDGRIWQVRGDCVRDDKGNITGTVEVVLDITERKQAEKNLIEYQSQLKHLASQLTLAEERERRRIATWLHDRISQSLVISKLKLDEMLKSAASVEFAEVLEETCERLGKTIEEVRSLTFELGSPILHELGFETAVADWLSEEIQQKHGIETEFEDDGQPKIMDDDIRAVLFRDVRELFMNVVKHAQARKIKVSIRKVGKQIKVSVEDDGRGFEWEEMKDSATEKGGFGLFSIQEGLKELGGGLDIESKPGKGTFVTLSAPLKQ